MDEGSKTIVIGCSTLYDRLDRALVEMRCRSAGGESNQMPGDAEPEEASGHPVTESKLMQLSGKTIVSAETDDESTLILTFSNAHRLYVFDDQPMYECYTMKFGDEEIFV